MRRVVARAAVRHARERLEQLDEVVVRVHIRLGVARLLAHGHGEGPRRPPRARRRRDGRVALPLPQLAEHGLVARVVADDEREVRRPPRRLEGPQHPPQQRALVDARGPDLDVAASTGIRAP